MRRKSLPLGEEVSAGWSLPAMTARFTPLVLLILVSAIMAGVIVTTNGNSFTASGLLAIIVIVFVAGYRTVWGFYLFISLVLVFDQFPPPGFSGVTSDTYFFSNLNVIPYLPTFEQGIITPLETVLVLVVFSWIITSAIRREWTLTSPKNASALLFFSAVILALGYGMSRGGDFVISLWETRAFFYWGLMLILVPQIITTRKEVENLIWVIIICISFKAFQGTYRFASLGFSFGNWPHVYETLTNHEDPVFFVTLFILSMGLVLFGVRHPQRRALFWLSGLLAMGYVAGQRRAAYASFMASICTLVVLMPKLERSRFLKNATAFLIIFACYVAVFWNSQSRFGAVALQFKATVTGEGGTRGEKDYSSTVYRQTEDYNLAYTYRTAPIIGIGFGMPFETPLRLWAIEKRLGTYIPHNQILWIFVKMGVVGALTFWFFLNSFVCYGASVFQRIADPYLKAVCVMCVVAVVNQLVVSNVDMQLTWHRNMIYLGTLMALVPVIDKLEKKESVQDLRT